MQGKARQGKAGSASIHLPTFAPGAAAALSAPPFFQAAAKKRPRPFGAGRPFTEEAMEEEKRERSSDPRRSYWVGAASNFFSVLATFPLHKTMFRQQLHAFSIREAGRQLCQEGLRQFCRGLLPPLLAKTLQGTLMFGTYDTFLRTLSGRRPPPGDRHSLGDRAAAGVLAGFSEGLVLGPFERVQNVLQDRRKVLRFPTTRSILREFGSYGGARERLALGYYRGLGLILLRNSLGSGLYFSSKDPLRDHFSGKGLPAWVPSLISGCINGTAISFLLYPLGVLITNVQAQVGRRETLGLGASVAAVWRTRGGRATLLYRGGSLLILRSGITWGLTTAIHDFLQEGSKGRHSHSQPPPPPQAPAPQLSSS